MDLKGLLLLALLSLLDLTPGMSILYKEDISFAAKLIVNNRTVSCGQHVSSKYSFPMYTCNNISVEGWPVFHGINDYREDLTTFNNNGCPGCPCGTYENEYNDIIGLCSAMLSAQGITDKKVLAAYTPSPICQQKKKEERIKFFIDEGEEQWLEVKENNGYLSKLQCRVEDA